VVPAILPGAVHIDLSKAAIVQEEAEIHHRESSAATSFAAPHPLPPLPQREGISMVFSDQLLGKFVGFMGRVRFDPAMGR